MTGIFAALADLIGSALDPAASDTLPPAPDVIADVGQWLDDLKDNSASVDGDLGGLQHLLDKFRPPDAPGFGDSVLVRTLQHSAPRIAGTLSLLGVIEYHPEPPSHHLIRSDRLQRLLTAPQDLVADLEAKAGLPDPVRAAVNTHLLTVQLAALLVAPRPLLLMEHNGQGAGALPVGPDGAGIALPAGSPLQPVFDAPWLFTVEIPTAAALRDLRPDAAGVAAFLAYLATQDVHPENALPDLTLPTLPTPHVESPNLVLPKFTPGSLMFGAALRVNRPDDLFTMFPIAHGWRLTVDGPGGQPGVDLVFDGAAWTARSEPPDTGELVVSLVRADAISLLHAGGLTVDAASVSVFARLRPAAGDQPLFSLGVRIADLRARLSSEYLKLLGLGDALEVVLDLEAGYDEGRGLRVTGGPGGSPALGIDIVTPIDRTIGAGGVTLTVKQARVRLGTALTGDGLAVRVDVRLSVSALLGPVTATITDFGAWAGSSEGRSFGLLSPSGVGIAIDAGVVRGGGFMAESPPGSGRFLGALSLSVLAIGVSAFGIYEKTAAGRTSLVVVLGARFPGVQLGFGFMLTGIGGVVGINRRADVDQLSARLASGAAGNVLFCEDPVRNAPALFDDLAAFLPPADGVFVIGPTLQLTWLYIVRLDIGVLIELPGPSKIIVVGSARASIPGLGSAVPLVDLRIDVLGGIDFTTSLVFFDASLVDSSVLAVFTLTGDAAFRFSYGASPYVLLSIGGFHPSYNPEPIKIRALARASAGYSVDEGIHIWMRSTFYFAFTPNTLQLGGGVEAGLEIGPVAAHGHFAFDALVQFKPFYFVFTVSAGFDIEFGDVTLCSVTIDGQVSGPGPLVVSAAVSFKILFVRFRFDATFSLGGGHGDVQRVDVPVLDELLKEVPRIENIHTEDGERAVVLAPVTTPGIALVSASSRISWTQRLAPFGVRLQRFGGTPLSREYQVGLAAAVAADPVKDTFGLGSYADVSSAQALNNDAFHREQAGMALSRGVGPGGTPAGVTITMKVVNIPSHRTLFEGVTAWSLSAALHGAVGAPGGVARVAPAEPLVAVRDETWRVHDAAGNVIAAGVSAFGAFQTGRATGGFSVPVGEEPLDLAGV